jgi:hypothetical protein
MIYIPESGMRALLAETAKCPPTGTLDFGAAFLARPGLAARFAAPHEVLHNSAQRPMACSCGLSDGMGSQRESVATRVVQQRSVDPVMFLLKSKSSAKRSHRNWGRA